MRKSLGLTLDDVSKRTGLSVPTLSKLEQGKASLSYDKLFTISAGLGVDMAELLTPAPQDGARAIQGSGRRVVERRGEGLSVETHSYKQLYLGTELLHKRLTPLIAELQARTLEEFIAEFGGLIKHPGEEFCLVLQGEVEFHSELYAPVRLKQGDSIYFDSGMGHAYLAGTDGTCRVLAVVAGDDAAGHETLREILASSKSMHE